MVWGPVLFLLEQKGGATAKLTSKLKQIRGDTAEAKEQVTNGHSVNFRDEVTQIVSDVKVLSATLSKISEIQESRDRQAVDTRLQALDKRAQADHASIWDALRKHHS